MSVKESNHLIVSGILPGLFLGIFIATNRGGIIDALLIGLNGFLIGASFIEWRYLNAEGR